eukprot:g8049.t1
MKLLLCALALAATTADEAKLTLQTTDQDAKDAAVITWDGEKLNIPQHTYPLSVLTNKVGTLIGKVTNIEGRLDKIEDVINKTPLHYHAFHASQCKDGTINKDTLECKCNPGYRGGGPWKKGSEEYPPCENINECDEKTYKCDTNARCVDTPGSYTCTCTAGWRSEGRAPEGRNTKCVDIDECAEKKFKCDINEKCVNNVGLTAERKGYTCACKSGYT